MSHTVQISPFERKDIGGSIAGTVIGYLTFVLFHVLTTGMTSGWALAGLKPDAASLLWSSLGAISGSCACAVWISRLSFRGQPFSLVRGALAGLVSGGLVYLVIWVFNTAVNGG